MPADPTRAELDALMMRRYYEESVAETARLAQARWIAADGQISLDQQWAGANRLARPFIEYDPSMQTPDQILPPPQAVVGVDPAVPGADRTALQPPIQEMEFRQREAESAIARAAGLYPIQMPAGVEVNVSDAKIAAERLIRNVLPEEYSVSLSAIGSFDYQAKKYKYRLFKNQKTHCFQGDKTFSCCIQLSDSSAPDSDRIVAEYLLLKNDEKKYLKTANLTQIGMPMGIPVQWTATQIAARPRLRERDFRVGYYENQWRGITPLQAVAQECFRMLFGEPPLDRPFPEFQRDEWQGMYHPQAFNVLLDDLGMDRYGHDMAQIRERVLLAPIEQLRQELSLERVNLMGFLNLRNEYRVGDQSTACVYQAGKSLMLARTMNIQHYRYETRLQVVALIPR